jgi:uncharacterized protein (DUF433 family)
MDWQERIVVDPDLGKTVIKGTRIAADSIIDLLSRGYSRERILRQFAGLTAEDVQACALYAEWRQSDLITLE